MIGGHTSSQISWYVWRRPASWPCPVERTKLQSSVWIRLCQGHRLPFRCHPSWATGRALPRRSLSWQLWSWGEVQVQPVESWDAAEKPLPETKAGNLFFSFFITKKFKLGPKKIIREFPRTLANISEHNLKY